MELVLDIENTVTFLPVSPKETLTIGNPYRPTNKLVAVGYTTLDASQPTNITFHHNTGKATPNGATQVQEMLDKTTLLIGHNLKHDLAWLRECGFVYNGKCWDTILAAYIFSKGRKEGTSLKDCVARMGIDGHKGDLMSTYLDNEVNVDNMPYEELLEYLDNDVEITKQLYLHQLTYLENSGTNRPHFEKALNLVNSFLPYLVDMERAGVYVNQDTLASIKHEYETELNQVNNTITMMVRELMGDRPYNLNSPDDLCAIVYSRRPRDKRQWAIDFNIGTELRNGVPKPKRITTYKREAFQQKLRTGTIIERKSQAKQCSTCLGKGFIYTVTKKGVPYKKMPTCKTCGGSGIEYIYKNEIAGLALPPQNRYASSAGFACNADVIEELLELRLPDKAKNFLGLISRRNKLEVWVNTFCFQLQKYAINGIIHPSFNQHITATGRLSCTAPNMQNQPKRDKTFKLRKAFVSRWKGGRLYEADFGQLEFRIAALLANCTAAIEFIEAGNDIHCVTRDFYYGDLELKPKHPWPKGNPKDDRQTAKAECVPLNSLILTRSGWKSYYDVEVGEDVLAYDQVGNQTKWTPLLRKVFYENAECISMGNKHNWKVTCTPDHRWYGTVRTTRSGVRRNYSCEVLAEDITQEHNIITAAYCQEAGSNVCPPHVAALLGWVYSDGTIRVSPLTGKTSQGADGRRRAICASILQKKFTAEVEQVLLDTGVIYSTVTREDGCNIYRLSSDSMRTMFILAGLDPENPSFDSWVLSLSPEARKAFLNAVFLAEGHTREYGTKCISQNVGPFQEAIHLACTLEGYDVRLTHKIGYTGNDNVRMTLRNRSHIGGSRLTKEHVSNQDVWCPQTKYGSWVMKQGDVVTITGNTFGPLYGKDTEWTEMFYHKFPGIAEWHDRLMTEAATTKQTISPSGRIYSFPFAERYVNHKGKLMTSGQTQIKNYSVQGFATGDLVLLVLMDIMDYLYRHNAKSKLCLQVHDSALVDAHPDEFQLVEDAFSFAFGNIYKKAKEFFGVDINVPLAFDLEYGVNWYGDKE